MNCPDSSRDEPVAAGEVTIKVLKISGVFVALAGFVAMLGGACSSNKDPSTFGQTTSSSATGTMSGPTGAGGTISGSSTTGIITTTGVGGAGGSGNTGPCVNLQCQQTTCTLGSCKEMPCAAGTRTSVSGIVYDPAGKD